MAEAEEDSTSRNPEEDGAASNDAGAGAGAAAPADEAAAGRPAPMSTGDFAVAALDEEKAEEAAAREAAAGEEAAEAAGAAAPGVLSRGIRWLLRWHPLVFLAGATALAAYAWSVYPESETRAIPPAELFYDDGLDRLYRVINPDLPLIAASPGDEALAARNAFLNLFVFHREHLSDYPQFINPHLLLAESNRILADYNP
ncbi:MAG: hypothetical protein LBS30_07485, partial [Planctomycetota bacterium]|nr:hypothetical protein [Planctomycetota bacterium]